MCKFIDIHICCDHIKRWFSKNTLHFCHFCAWIKCDCCYNTKSPINLTGKRLPLRLITTNYYVCSYYVCCACDASTRLPLCIPQQSKSPCNVRCVRSCSWERAIPLGSEQDRTGVSRIWSRGVWDTGQRWLFSLAAAPAWWGGRSWTGRLPPVATRTYPAGSQTSSMASALRCVAVVLSREKSRLIHCFCVLYCTKYFFSKNSLISSF